MKKLALVIAVLLTSNLYANLAKLEIVNSNEEISYKKMIERLYNQEVAKKDSPLRKKMVSLLSATLQEDDYVFIIGDDFSNISDEDQYDEKVFLGDAVNIGSGKSGAAFYGADYIVPVQIASPGSGLIVQTEFFIKVGAYDSFYDYDTGEEIHRTGVIFESLVSLKTL